MRSKTKRVVGIVVDTIKAEQNSTYLQKKFDDHRLYTAAFIAILIPLGIADWMFDYMIDPTSADKTIGHRLLFVWMIAPALAILRTQNYQKAATLVIFTAVAAMAHTLAILNTLDGDFGEIMGGFMIFPFLIVLLCLGFSVKINLLGMTLAILAPLLLASAGWLKGFSHQLYFLYLAQPTLALVFIIAMLSWGYHRRYVLERSLEESSNTDPLTGVANRRHFNALLRREIARGNRLKHDFTLLMLDIDHFKKINDTFGHPSGDRVICTLAEVCVDMSRDTDAVARLGGEEFAIIMPGANHADSSGIAERIRQRIENSVVMGDRGENIRLTVSIGAASIKGDGNDIEPDTQILENIIRRADHALYEAKNKGRNQVVFYAE